MGGRTVGSGSRRRRPKGRGRRGLGVFGYLGIAGAGVGAVLVLGRELWSGYEYLAWIGAWSLATLLTYAYDKAAARSGQDDRGKSQAARVDELALHLMAMLGGFVGGWVGRHGFRHKTRKPVFGVVLGLATVLHAAALLWRHGVIEL